ncbi:MAG: glycerate kinase type-2 family protein [Thermoguttaceae bacterium]
MDTEDLYPSAALPSAMKRSTEQLRADALQIWKAGVAAVDSERLVREAFRVEGGRLFLGDEQIDLHRIARIAVVGAGKAGAGMAAAVEAVLGEELLEAKQVQGWVNVPEGCRRPLRQIHLHPARPAGINEPTEAGVEGARRILELATQLGPDDLCLCLISGGGSALAPAPADAVTLADKLAVTRHLSAAGANIEQLNIVRKQLSRIKGGGLARACRAGRLWALIISDVLGNPLDVISSGPTVPDRGTPQMALEVLEQFHAREAGIDARVFDYLRSKSRKPAEPPTCRVHNQVIGSNATAVDAAGMEAERLGYSHAMVSAAESEGPAEEVGRHLARMARRMRLESGPDCLVSGGEPVVQLVEKARRGRGGRNQQLVLAALEELQGNLDGIALLSGGTDGEDGPTDAAGALLDADVASAARSRALDPHDFLARNDAYHFFAPLGALIVTGPTHTNVCDLRVVVVDRPQ